MVHPAVFLIAKIAEARERYRKFWLESEDSIFQLSNFLLHGIRIIGVITDPLREGKLRHEHGGLADQTVDVVNLRVRANAVVEVQNAFALGTKHYEGVHRSHGSTQNFEARFQGQPAI